MKRKKTKGESPRRIAHCQPNWIDNPSGTELCLMKLALQKCNQDLMQMVLKNPNFYSWVEFVFGGGLLINSFVDDDCIWYHMNFKAKVQVIDTSKSNMGKKGPHLVFAEVKRPLGKPDYEVTSCHIVGPSKFFDHPRLLGCKACDVCLYKEWMIHPNREFNVGHQLVADANTTGEDKELHD